MEGDFESEATADALATRETGEASHEADAYESRGALREIAGAIFVAMLLALSGGVISIVTAMAVSAVTGK